jgi:2-keto-4-pentenoate hydratase/2-oxohepta-3-ene-1,7-dioic acid hydratase in catechol pathway
MRLATVVLDGVAVPGIVNKELNKVVPLSGHADMIAFLAAGPEAWRAAEETARDESKWLPFFRMLAPIPRPTKLIEIGLNYRDHAQELGQEIPKKPVVFTKFTSAVIGPGENIVLTDKTTQPDYEGELAIVIGKGGKNIKAEDWREHVFGYTVANDVTARDVQFSVSQWDMGKSFDTFGPMGPAIVTLDEIGDPHTLAIRLDIDGQVMQQSNTDQLIFKTGALLEYLSSMLTLEPGDVISTGTPPGVGMGRKPQRWLKPGETVSVKIEGIGRLSNPIVQG